MHALPPRSTLFPYTTLFRSDRALRPYLVTRRWVREKFSEWGPGHPLWEARVLGQFPTQAEDALISLAWLEAARSEEHTSELQSLTNLVCRLLLEKKKTTHSC